MPARISDRVKYRSRIKHLIDNPPVGGGSRLSEFETMAHWAKYICVLVSGYIEQAVKEVLIEHSNASASPKIARYVEKSWPSSKNMACNAITDILEYFDLSWKESFLSWIDEEAERKKEINEIVAWRNNIAHGKEASTNNVTIGSIKTKFRSACELVDFLERLT